MWSFIKKVRAQTCTGRCASPSQCPVGNVQNLVLHMQTEEVSVANAKNKKSFRKEEYWENPSYLPYDWDQDPNAQILRGMPMTIAAPPVFSNLGLLFIIQLISFSCQWFRSLPKNPINIQGPNLFRWFEYALTSPLQLYIVATQMLIGDLLTLLALIAAQIGLIMCGFCCELLIQRLYKLQSKLHQFLQEESKKGTIEYKIKMVRWKLVVISVLAWVIHLLIWCSLLRHWDNQWALSTRCSVNKKPPRAVFFLIWSQFLGFTAFGLIQGVQIFQGIKKSNSSPDDAESRLMENHGDDQGQIQAIDFNQKGKEGLSQGDQKKHDRKKKEKFKISLKWLKYTRWYALLSITVKVLLELSYFATAVAMPDIKSMHFIH